MEDFFSYYETQCASLNISPRHEVIEQMHLILQDGYQMTYGKHMHRLTRAYASRRERDASSSSSSSSIRPFKLELAGNTLQTFHDRMRNIHFVVLVSSLLQAKVEGLAVLDLKYNHLGEEQQQDQDNGEKNNNTEKEYTFDPPIYLCRLLQSTKMMTSILEEIHLEGNRLGHESIQLLCDGLREIGLKSPLRRLYLDQNPIKSLGGHALAHFLQDPECTLHVLSLNHTEMDMSNVIAFATSLRTNTQLKELYLNAPCMPKGKEQEPLQYLAKALQINTSLQVLSLGGFCMTDETAQMFAERLLENKTLHSLRLRGNAIGSTGAKALAALLLKHPTLEEIDLSANRIGDAGAMAFAQVIQLKTSPLKILSLCSCSIKDTGLAAIARACNGITDAITLKALFLWGNTFGPMSSELFLKAQETVFLQNQIETDIKAYKVDDQDVHVAHEDVFDEYYKNFASSKK
jgi:Ran GTPase-activating protein (RanGAP) involved in mRNA processing and transport